jgi:saccharopine dehydrogenase-like NADP-dependent oxidoreductase
LGTFESYPNRDSLQYVSKYGLAGAKTIIRSTLRRKGFCEAWNALVQLGLTDDTCTIEHVDQLSHAQWVSSFLPGQKKREASPLDERVTKFLGKGKKDGIIRRLRWLGLFSDDKIPMAHGTSAQILQDLIERKWVMNSGDQDMIVMRHEIQYSMGRKKQKKRRKVSTLVVTGDNPVQTAMAKTVGLPMAIMAKLLLQRNVSLTGLHIPVMPEVYLPVLKELESLNIKFDHKTESD